MEEHFYLLLVFALLGMSVLWPKQPRAVVLVALTGIVFRIIAKVIGRRIR